MTTTSPEHDPPVADGCVAVGLGVEDAGRTAMQPPLVAGELDDAAVRRERAVQDRQSAGRLERRLDREDDLLAGCLAPPPRSRRSSGRRLWLVAVEQARA